MIDHSWTGHRQLGREHTRAGKNTAIELELNGFGEMVETSAYRGNPRILREQLERDVMGRVRSVRLHAKDVAKDAWYGFEYDTRLALPTSWEAEVPRGAGNPGSSGNGNATGNGNAHGVGNGNAPQTGVGTHTGATNTSVASRAAALDAVPYTRTRAQAVGTLQAIQEDGLPVWEATHSTVGHRLTGSPTGLARGPWRTTHSGA